MKIFNNFRNNFYFQLACCTILTTCFQATAWAAYPSNFLQSLVRTDTAAGSDRFGDSVSLSGDTALVGAPGDDQVGSAYIYVKDTDGTWIQQTKLTNPVSFDPDSGLGNFGDSVSLSGNTAIIGDTDGNDTKGAAYVYTRSGSTWSTAPITLTDPSGIADDSFGNSVSLSGDTALVGSPFSNDYKGGAHIFVRDSNGIWTHQQELIAPEGVEDDGFGLRVFLDGDTALIAATGDNADKGSVYVFVRSGTIWTFQQELTASDSGSLDNFGSSVSLSGNTALIGADLHNNGTINNSGAAYIFVRSGTTWTQAVKLAPLDLAASDNFGQAVSLSDNTAIIGAPGRDSGSINNAGAVYVFVKQTDGTWAEQPRLTRPTSSLAFGGSVSLENGVALIGAPSTSSSSGAAYIFVPLLDTDGDGINDDEDNCPAAANPDQTDTDGDLVGDACDSDQDNDTILNEDDNCPLVSNSDQADLDSDSIGDVCDSDRDGDGIDDAVDNCPLVSNTDQINTDGDEEGDACDADDDNDGIPDGDDSCPLISNSGQDQDNDGIDDACDSEVVIDADSDGVPDDQDNCPTVANGTQDDFDGDLLGDVCDPDSDEDDVPDLNDQCPFTALNQLGTVNPSTGCSLEQACPCSGPRGSTLPWKLNAAYVLCVGHNAHELVESGVITFKEKIRITLAAAKQNCGFKLKDLIKKIIDRD